MIPLRDNVTRRTWPVVNLLLITINAYIFYIELKQPTPQALHELIQSWGLLSGRLLNDPLRETPHLFTSMFLHGGWLHVLGNMLYLWIFGDNVEDRLGHVRYLFFYLLTGAAAGLTQAFLTPRGTVPMIGASGAIAGVMGAYFILYPRARIITLVPIWIFLRIMEIPAILFLGLWFVLQALQGWGSLLAHGSTPPGGVAWWAHAGGFVAGVILVFFLRQPKRR
jgi:membrane associated rhomboid family serine protease